MNAELCKQALEKVGSPNTLVNIISKRVRQLTAGGGAGSRPLVLETANLGAADIALREVVEGKMGWEFFEDSPLAEWTGRKRRRG